MCTVKVEYPHHTWVYYMFRKSVFQFGFLGTIIVFLRIKGQFDHKIHLFSITGANHRYCIPGIQYLCANINRKFRLLTVDD